jgi:hypothetical protein
MDLKRSELLDEDFSLIEYIRENIVGLLLLFLTGFIIYLVDYITNINPIIYATAPGLAIQIPINNTKKLKRNKILK